MGEFVELKAFCKYLDQLLPSEKLVDYAPNGLQVEGKAEVMKVATAVSASLETIVEAVEAGVDALIVHHGLFWQKDSYVIQGVKKDKLALLLEKGISLFAYHLPLDMHMQLGNNWKAALEMGWQDLQPFCYMNGAPVGVKGKISPCTQVELKEKLERYYEHTASCALGGPKTIKTLALVSGGAYRNLIDASREGLDAYITGNFDEPAWHQAYEEKINFFALGHSATERVGPKALSDHLEKQLGLPCTFIDIPNPF